MSQDVEYYTGLDLGQAQDFTAVAVLERSVVWDAGRKEEVAHYAVRHLERLALGTPYTEVCVRMAGLFAAAPLKDGTLAVDQTGVGRPVVDMLRRAGIEADIKPITITGGHKAHADEEGGWLVPKKDLVGVLQVLLQSRRLRVAPTLPEAPTLVEELTNFQVKITASAHETFGAWREGTHDDLVLAVAVAAWVAERFPPVEMAVPMVLGSPPGWQWPPGYRRG